MKHWDFEQGKETNHDVRRNIGNLRLDYKILSPLLKKMTENSHQLKVVDSIMEEVGKIFVKCKVNHDGERVYRESWAIRKLLSLAKSQTWKDRNPKDHAGL